jgi:hypothetical protein
VEEIARGADEVKTSIVIFAGLFTLATPSFAWDGYDYDKGTYVEIGPGNLVRPGREIEVYDYSRGQYLYMDVESIRGTGSGAEIEVYDNETGEYRTLDMD